MTALLEDALARARKWAAELGCADELETLPSLLERGGGAGGQRTTYEIAGIDAVIRELIESSRRTG